METNKEFCERVYSLLNRHPFDADGPDADVALLLDALSRLEKADEKKEELVDALGEMVNQHCDVGDEDGKRCLDSMALSSNEHAMRVLVKHGKIRIKKEYGRRVVGEWIEQEARDED
jgi:hypothetical protein